MRSWLKNMRTKAGLSMKDMAQKLDISESYYSMIESGDRQKKMDLVLATGIAAVFGVSVAEITAMEQDV